MSAKPILSKEEVVKALDLDSDFDAEKTESLSQRASDFLMLHTGKDWGADQEINSMAKQCAEFLCVIFYRNDQSYKPTVDYLMADLRDVARLEKRGAKNGAP